jgi:hypothetical protein
MTRYNQQEIDQRFEALLHHCHTLGFHQLAAHYEKAQGMQRVHAIRFLEAVFSIRAQNERKIIRSLAAIMMALLVLALVVVVWLKGIS